ncbi:MAG: thymidylate kinase [Desulfotomaculaceae bacterium]|nr:thymidylate kinase [Desulfotomaculaceae bacterium]
MKGKLIAIESGDGCGKETQSEMLYKRLLCDGCNVKKISFPNYKSSSAALINMYLSGEFGSDPGEVSPYVASTFYTVDRFASYKKDWESFYLSGGIILADRYTTANMVHQAAKISDEREKKKYLDWLLDFEFNIFRLPVPDLVIFLDMPPEYSRRLIIGRVSKSGVKDIHEHNYDYMVKTYYNACSIAEQYHWAIIKSVADGQLKNIEEIHEEIYRIVKAIIG